MLRTRTALPDPDARGKRLSISEAFVPADEPVTVIGTPRRGRASGSGTIDRAETALQKRVSGCGIFGGMLLLGGQSIAFALSSASLSALL
ncbi:hypothetical protein [Halopiger djelfimassiliensis]|uniref:hypothetical protein n=1 Tax=Halopiger djelfimassiliensis TaxID=1293047 RepID=UPI000677DEBD|nr:hypothetical protein [Halopiger djelfimassiliensis]